MIDAFSDVLMLDEMSQPFQIKDCTDMRMEGVTVIFDGSGNIQGKVFVKYNFSRHDKSRKSCFPVNLYC